MSHFMCFPCEDQPIRLKIETDNDCKCNCNSTCFSFLRRRSCTNDEVEKIQEVARTHIQMIETQEILKPQRVKKRIKVKKHRVGG